MPVRQLINVLTVRGGKDSDGNKLPLKHTGLYIVEKIDGEKRMRFIADPTITFRVTKQNKVDQYLDPPPLFVPIEDTFPVTCKYWEYMREIAKYLGEMDFYEACLQEKHFGKLKQLHLDPILHGSDVDISDHTISRYLSKYKSEVDLTASLTKGFWDIEVDSSNIPGFPIAEEAPSPINLIGYYDQQENILYQFVLRNPKNTLIGIFEDTQIEKYTKTIQKKFKNECPNLEIEIEFFDKELDLIKAFFKLLNERCKPDILHAWNLSFDGQTVINRIKILGGIPALIMCPKEVDYKQVYYYTDTRAKDISEKKDQLQITSDVIFLDQMIQYAVIRKSMQKKDSYMLDAVLTEELSMSKDEVVDDMKKFPYSNFLKFMEYNAMDVIGCYLIEKKIGDTDLIYQLSLMTETRMNKAMTKTICLRNMADRFFRDQGYVLSNNRNQDYGSDEWKSKEDEDKDDAKKKFRGAFVANPKLLAHTGIPVLGIKSNKIFEKTCDLDLASLYPSIIQGFNIDSFTQIGKAFLVEQFEDVYVYNNKSQLKLENKLNDEIPKIIDSIQAKDFIATGKKYFNLPDLQELLEVV
jgi:hypothetical protein